MPITIKSPEEINQEIDTIKSWLSYRPSKKQCNNYTKIHTEQHANSHFYLLSFNNVTHTFSSDNMHRSNILDLMKGSLEKGSFVSLEKITIKQYAKNGGGDIPCCLINCQYEGDWPPCMQR